MVTKDVFNVEKTRLLNYMFKEVLEILLKTNLDLNGVLELLKLYTGFDYIGIYLKNGLKYQYNQINIDIDWTSLNDIKYNIDYISKSIIKIRSVDNSILGIIILLDHEEDIFTHAIINIFENIAFNISMSILRQQSLKENQDLCKTLIYKNHLLESFKVISHLLLDCDENTIFNHILQIIGETFLVSRVYLFETFPLNKNNYILNYKYEWCNENIEPHLNNINLKNVSFNDLKILEIQKQLLNNKIVIVNNVNILDLESQKIFTDQDIKSFILVPIFYPTNNLYGFIGVDECEIFRTWNKCEISSLINLSNLLGIYIKKCYLGKRLNKFINDQNIILNNLDSYVWFFRDIYTYGFINEKYYVDFIEREDLGENQTTYKNDCLISECHIKEESELQISTNKQVLETKEIIEYEQWLTNKCGEKRLLGVRKILVNDTYIVCIAKDLTVQYLQDKKIIKTLTNIYKENTKVLDENIQSMQQMYSRES